MKSKDTSGEECICRCYNRNSHAMYARKLQVDIVTGGERRPCPLDWLDAFAMRNFTGDAEFDDTLPVGEGLLEVSFDVDPARLSSALSEWATRRGKGDGRPVSIEMRELPRG